MIDATGERMIATYRDQRIETGARARSRRGWSQNVSLLLADNRFPDFVRPICEAARRRGIPVVLDADRPTVEDDPLFAIPTHVIFSSECLRETTGLDDLAAGLMRMTPRTSAFLAVSDGPGAVRYLADGSVRAMPVFKVDAIDTLAAGDVFHAGIALALAEGRDEVAAMRFGAAAAGLKCTRFGGSMGAPTRAEVEAFLASRLRASVPDVAQAKPCAVSQGRAAQGHDQAAVRSTRESASARSSSPASRTSIGCSSTPNDGAAV